MDSIQSLKHTVVVQLSYAECNYAKWSSYLCMHGSQGTGKTCFPQCFLYFIRISMLWFLKSNMDGIWNLKYTFSHNFHMLNPVIQIDSVYFDCMMKKKLEKMVFHIVMSWLYLLTTVPCDCFSHRNDICNLKLKLLYKYLCDHEWY